MIERTAALASVRSSALRNSADIPMFRAIERMDGAGEVKNVLREEMADERRRLKDEHAAQQEARRLKREAEQQRRAEAARNGQARHLHHDHPCVLGLVRMHANNRIAYQCHVRIARSFSFCACQFSSHLSRAH
jgi:hypothetical protein